MMTNATPTKPASRPQSRVWATFKALLRARVTAGLLIVLPLWLTFLLVKFVFGLMQDASQWVVDFLVPREALVDWIQKNVLFLAPEGFRTWAGLEDRQLAVSIEEWGIAIFSVILTISILYLIGLATANIVGRRTLEAVESLFDRLPLVKTVYRSSKQILTTFGGEQASTFQRVVLFPFMVEGVYSVGFITNVFKDVASGDELCTVFFTTTPNPTTGYILICKRNQIIEVDWTVEEAVKAIMSGGILLPANLAVSIARSPIPPALLPKA